MPHIECTQCSTVFDTEREPPIPHADTTRCKSCGQKHDVDTTPVIRPSEPAETEPVKYTCPVCETGLPSRDHLADHLSDHGVITAVSKQAEAGKLPRAYTDGGESAHEPRSETIDINLNVNLRIDDE